MNKFGRIVIALLAWMVLACLLAYAAGAVNNVAPFSENTRIFFSALIGAVSVYALFVNRYWRRRLILTVPILVVVYGWYATVQPKLIADWQPDVATLPDVELQGDILKVRHIRDFRYQGESGFDVRYYDRDFNLNDVRTVDLFLCYWGTTSIAHTIMSFGFQGGAQLAISIETRKEKGEEYSAVQGFFKKFELIYVVADERDLIGVRVNQRAEDVYLYRLKPTPEQVRKMLLDYVKTIDKLESTPVFYNALLTNCTTSILPHIAAFKAVKFNWALIANGYIDRWRYDEGIWGKEIPFDEFRRRSKVNDAVKKFVEDPDFSVKIRQGLPSFPATADRPA